MLFNLIIVYFKLTIIKLVDAIYATFWKLKPFIVIRLQALQFSFKVFHSFLCSTHFLKQVVIAIILMGIKIISLAF